MLIPGPEDRDVVHQVIYDELVVGKIRPASKARYINIMEGMVAGGVEGIILGCTEIGLLVGPEDVRVPVFDTTLIHAAAAVEYALREH